MKHECNVARDLMPLCIDGAASEESQQFVDEHVAECGECNAIYGEMNAALPQMREEKENAVLEKAARNMRTKRTIRALWAIIISMAALIIVILANLDEVEKMLDDALFHLRYVGRNSEIRLDAFDIMLRKEKDSDHSPATLTVHSYPCGSHSFTPDMILRYDEMTGDAYLRIRFYYTKEDRLKDQIGRSSYFWQLPGTLFFEQGDCIYYSSYDIYEEARPTDGVFYEDVELARIELAYGDEITILWSNEFGLPAIWNNGYLRQSPIATPTPTPDQPFTTSPASTEKPTVTPTATPTSTPEPTSTTKLELPWWKRKP